MKILFLVRKFWPSVGGVEKHCLEIGKRLVERGDEVTVVTEADANFKFEILNFKSIFKYQNISIFKIPITLGEKFKKFQIWQWLWKNRKLIEEADIVHCHDVFFWYFPFRFLYPKKKVFTTFHGWEGKFPPSFKVKLIRKISEKLSNGNICVGDFITKWYGTRANLITYGAVGEPKEQGEKKNQKDKRKYNIVFIGRLEEDTGLGIYLKAIEKCKMYNPSTSSGQVVQFTITFAGDGSLRKEAEKYGKVLGFVQNVEEYIRESKFVFTSGYLSILEGMINKKLVFSVYNNPLKEDYLRMAPFAKWIVIGKDPEELAAKVKFYFEDSIGEKKLVGEGYNWAKQQSWEKLTEKYLGLWGKIRVFREV